MQLATGLQPSANKCAGQVRNTSSPALSLGHVTATPQVRVPTHASVHLPFPLLRPLILIGPGACASRSAGRAGPSHGDLGLTGDEGMRAAFPLEW